MSRFDDLIGDITTLGNYGQVNLIVDCLHFIRAYESLCFLRISDPANDQIWIFERVEKSVVVEKRIFPFDIFAVVIRLIQNRPFSVTSTNYCGYGYFLKLT